MPCRAPYSPAAPRPTPGRHAINRWGTLAERATPARCSSGAARRGMRTRYRLNREAQRRTHRLVHPQHVRKRVMVERKVTTRGLEALERRQNVVLVPCRALQRACIRVSTASRFGECTCRIGQRRRHGARILKYCNTYTMSVGEHGPSPRPFRAKLSLWTPSHTRLARLTQQPRRARHQRSRPLRFPRLSPSVKIKTRGHRSRPWSAVPQWAVVVALPAQPDLFPFNFFLVQHSDEASGVCGNEKCQRSRCSRPRLPGIGQTKAIVRDQ